MKKFVLTVFFLVTWCGLAPAQQLPTGLVNLGIPVGLAAQLPTCNAAAGPLLYTITDSANACAYGNAVAGSGSLTCNVQCDAATSTWRMAQPPDIAPPTTINFLTGTGGGYTNCVSGGTTSGCATGGAQFAINNGTINTGNLNFSSTSLNLTTGCSGGTCVGANVTVVEQDATVTSGSGWPQYNGCWKQCTIASVTNATTGVCNTPSASSGTCSASTGLNGTTGANPDTNATIVVWDGKDQTAFANANTAAGALVTAFNAGAVIYLPCGTYVIGAANGFGNQLSGGITVQGQSPACVTVINPYFTGNSMIMAMGSGSKVRGITFAGTDTNAHADGFSRRTSDGLLVISGNATGIIANNSEISGNVFEYNWSDQGPVALNAGLGNGTTAAPCAFGSYVNKSGTCTKEPTGNLITGNYFHNCESWGTQLSGGVGNVIVDNKYLDCGPVNIENGDTTVMTSAMAAGNLIGWNDSRCDSVGDGVNNDAVAVSLSRTPYDGCTMYSQDDNTANLNLSTNRFIGNHLRADNTSPSAGFSCGGSAIATVRSNTCTTGEHCANGLNGTNC